MKTPEEIKNGLECCSMPGCKGEDCPYNLDDPCHFTMHEDALAYIHQLETQSAKDINVPGWISTKDRLPDISDIVLVTANGRAK